AEELRSSVCCYISKFYLRVVLRERSMLYIFYKSFVSWARFYASYPKEVRNSFSFKEVHLGHFAKSFALRDPPSKIGGIVRRQFEHKKQHQQKHQQIRVKRPRPGSSSRKQREVSEFSSGLEPMKKKKK
ncbi:hypothetical protein L9F63_012108, partial [Diploptera punctata]